MRRLLRYMLSMLALIRARRVATLGVGTTLGARARVVNPGPKSAVTIADGVSLHGTIEVAEGGEVSIGDRTTIRFATEIECAKRVTIGRNVIISNNVIISDNDSHPVSPRLRELMSASDHDGDLWTWKHAKSAPVTIEENVWIGRRVLVTKGVTIGKGSIVAAGAVVTKSVPPYSLCFGNPCVIRAGIYEEAGS